jgi:hypothetical protein
MPQTVSITLARVRGLVGIGHCVDTYETKEIYDETRYSVRDKANVCVVYDGVEGVPDKVAGNMRE